MSLPSASYKNNFCEVRTTDTILYFSYRTLIAFESKKTGLVIRQNEWGITTGKHLNSVHPDHTIRISGKKFERIYREAFKI